MRKRMFLCGMIFLLLSLLLVGCGVAQEQHDAVVADLGKAQQEAQSIKAELEASRARVSELTLSLEKAESELEATQAENSELTSSLGKAETELEATQSELETTQGELEAVGTEYEAFKSDIKSLWDPLGRNLLINQTILSINAGLLLDDLDAVEQRCNTMTGKVAALGDPELQALWEEAYVVEGGQWVLHFGPFERFMAANDARIGANARPLREKLAE